MISVEVPATSANLGPGFDVLGLALELCNRVEAELASQVEIEVEGEGAERLARTESNLVYRSFKRYCAEIGRKAEPLHLQLRNQIPLARGLGSSSAAIVAGLLVGEAIHGAAVDRKSLLRWASDIEGHPDNVAAAILGGLTVAYQDGADVGAASFAPHPSVGALIVVPEERLSTSEARAVLPGSVSRDDAVFNIARSSLLVGAMIAGRADLFQEAMRDRLHQPARSRLLPHFRAMREALEQAGVEAVALSGAGPSVLALLDAAAGEAVAVRARKSLSVLGVSAKVLTCAIDRKGARIIASS